VPDDVPALGHVDAAIMLELVLCELRHEFESYEEFDEVPQGRVYEALCGRIAQAVSREGWPGSQWRARFKDARVDANTHQP
jgi:hypothetical protein